MTICGYPLWAVALICAGVFTAACVDAIGGGGGIISLPIYLFAGLPTHFALGTNKLSSGIGTAASTFRYIKNGFIKWELAAASVLLAVAGAHLGTRLQLMVEERYLKYMLLLVLPAVAVVLLRKKSLPETPGEIALWAQRGMSFVDACHAAGIGVILDWAPVHFCCWSSAIWPKWMSALPPATSSW